MKTLINNHILWLCVAIAYSSSDLPAQLSVVQTKNGTVAGYSKDDISIFKGIPFAAPPIGDLRWKAPQSMKKNWPRSPEMRWSFQQVQYKKIVPFMMWTEEFISPPNKS